MQKLQCRLSTHSTQSIDFLVVMRRQEKWVLRKHGVYNQRDVFNISVLVLLSLCGKTDTKHVYAIHHKLASFSHAQHQNRISVPRGNTMFSLWAYKLSTGGTINAALNASCGGVFRRRSSCLLWRVDRNFSRPPAHQSCGASQIAIVEYWPSHGFSNLRYG